MLCYKDRTIHDGNGEKCKSSSRTERRSEGSSGRLLQLPRGGLAEVQPANPVHRQRFACAAHVSSTLQRIYCLSRDLYIPCRAVVFLFRTDIGSWIIEDTPTEALSDLLSKDQREERASFSPSSCCCSLSVDSHLAAHVCPSLAAQRGT